MSLKVDLKSQGPGRKKWFDMGWALVAGCIVLSVFIFYGASARNQNTIAAKQKELSDWQTKVASFSGLSAQLASIQGEITTLKGQITHLWEMRYDPLRYSILLVRISKLLPQNMWLTSLTVDPAKSQVTISGTALALPSRPPLAGIAKFMMNLDNDLDHYFSNVTLQSTSSSGETGDSWTFNMNFNYDIPLSASSSAPPVQGGSK